MNEKGYIVRQNFENNKTNPVELVVEYYEADTLFLAERIFKGGYKSYEHPTMTKENKLNSDVFDQVYGKYSHDGIDLHLKYEKEIISIRYKGNMKIEEVLLSLEELYRDKR